MLLTLVSLLTLPLGTGVTCRQVPSSADTADQKGAERARCARTCVHALHVHIFL